MQDFPSRFCIKLLAGGSPFLLDVNPHMTIQQLTKQIGEIQNIEIESVFFGGHRFYSSNDITLEKIHNEIVKLNSFATVLFTKKKLEVITGVGDQKHTQFFPTPSTSPSSSGSNNNKLPNEYSFVT